jgi:hypothetical protein
MNYGAKESNTKEAMGLVALVVGLIIFVIGAAYGVGVIQPLFELIGLVVFVGSFYILRQAKTEG